MPHKTEDLAAAVRDALAAVADRHSPGEPQPQRQPQPRVYRQPQPQPLRQSTPTPTRTQAARAAAPKSARDYEGRYATVTIDGAPVRVYIHDVQQRSTGLKAYVMRQDSRDRCYVLLSALTEVSDDE